MADNTLSFVTSVDLSGLSAGLDKASENVEAFAGNLQDAMAAAAAAANQLSDAQIQLGAAAAQGNEQATAVIAGYQTALDAANASVQALTASEGVSDSAGQKQVFTRKQIANAIAAQNLATNRAIQSEQEAARSAELLALKNDILARSAIAAGESEAILGAATAEASAATGRLGISARQSATAGIGILEGRMMSGNRAAAAFAATTLGLGPILEAAFPIIGAVALGEVVVQVGKEFVKAFDIGGERARQTAEEIAKLDNEIKRSTDSLDVQIDKLAQEQAKLEKKPFNGLKLVLDEAAESADRLAERLDHVTDEELKAIKGMAGSLPQRALGIAGGTDYEQTMLKEHNKYIGQAVNTQQQLNESVSFGTSLQIRLTELKQKQQQVDAASVAAAQSGGILLKSNYQTEINAVNDLVKKQKEEQANIEATINLGKQEAATQTARDAHQAKGPKGPDLDTSRLKVIEEQFSELQEKSIAITGTGLTAAQAASYWTPFLDEFKADADKYRALIDEASTYAPGSAMAKSLLLEAQKLAGANEAYKHVLDEINKETEATHKLLFTQVLKADPQAALTLASGPIERDQALKGIKKDAEDDTKAVLQLAKGLEAVKKMVAELYTQPRAQEQHEQNLAGIETAQAKSTDANQLSLVPDPQAQLNQLRSFHAQAVAENERFLQQEIQIYAQEPKKVEELEKQLEEVRRRGNLQWLNDTKNIALQVAQAQQQAVQKMENDFANLFAKTLTGQESWVNASVKLYGQLADQFILNLAKMAEQELLALALHKTIASSKILTDAKVAAADSFQWASAWGGPIAGAIAAAVAFAGVLAFDSFEAGGVVAGSHGMPVPIMAHAGERVLSAPQTQNFERMVNGGGGSSHSTHINYAPNVSAFDNSGLKSTLRAHQDTILAIVREGYRSGSLAR